ncbi:AMP-binding protein [Nostoc sp. FACHB-152]|uniref:AMP-binding protein n=1 Tax=unclassified Nostoc TaxID=2593658 RepID=UPI0016859E38|nr:MULTISPECIES: AMP-binding protein [unclassified Nostoc]MBD2445565.1 AMP-binding protein [Nostoc sp. FACHB-152]MBD2466677.1 AMP-binding protein [Nostoc sp. FACHB-145]
MTKQLSLEQVLACGVETNIATTILPQVNQCLTCLPADCWQYLTQYILKPSHPFALHELLYKTTFSDWDKSQGYPPVWFPSQGQIQATNIAALMKELKLDTYTELHAWSAQHRAEFWDIIIQRLGIRFQEKYTKIVDLANGVESPQWLVGTQFNIVESCFQTSPDIPAIIFQPEGGSISTLSYGELHALTNRVANGLVNAGFQRGDAIAIMMPMTAESVAIYLGIVKAGCIVVSIADSFSTAEIAKRLYLSNVKAIFTQNYILRGGKQLPLYHKVVNADAPVAIVLGSSVELRSGDLTWKEFLSSNEQFDAFPTSAGAYTNILFSSGTTGEPKVIPWTQTTPIKCAADGHLHQDIHPGDVVAWHTNLGWMMGPWLIYASLINQAAIALYYGKPTEREYGQFIQDAGVNILGVVPSLVNSWKTTGCMQGLDWSAIKAFSSTGECSNPEDMFYLMSLAGYKPVIEYCGGTEIGGAYITGTLVQPSTPSTFTTPALGLDIIILDSDGHPTNKGEAFIIPPSIGLSTELLNADHHQIYFANVPQIQNLVPLRRHGDQIQRLPYSYYRAHGRVDDTMNLSGIKVSSTEIEQVLNAEPGICETAAIAVSCLSGGPSQLVLYVVVKPDVQEDKAAIAASLQKAINQRLNPLFKIHDIVIVDRLPRTASNKVMRRVLRDQYQGSLPQPTKLYPVR